MSTKKINFYNCPIAIPIIQFKLGDRDGFALVDTGSENTIIDAGFSVKNKKHIKIKTEREKFKLIGLGKSEDIKIVKAFTTIHVEDNKEHRLWPVSIYEANIMQLDHLTEHLKEERNMDIPVSMIIGSDILSDLNAQIDYENRQITVTI